jgi:hypothetical protein
LNEKLKKLENTYWKISKLVSVIATLVILSVITSVLSAIKTILLIIGIAIVTFLGLNLLDLLVGVVLSIAKYIKDAIRDRRLLKGNIKESKGE